MSNDHLISDNGLYFPPDVEWMRTDFRERALNRIYRAALDLCDGRLKSAFVSVDHTGEDDSEILDLTLTVDSDWEFIEKLRYDILATVGNWLREECSEEEKEDYGRRVYFALLPSRL